MAKIIKYGQLSQEITNQSERPLEDSALITASEKPISNEEIEGARENAFQAGYAQGIAVGCEQEREQTAEKVSLLNELINSIPSAIHDHQLQLSTDIANIVLMIVQEFFVAQQHDKQAITQRVLSILMQMKEHQAIEVILHSQDLARLQQDVFSSYHNLRLTSSEHLRLGGCLIKSEHGLFDSSIERQIDNLKQALLDIRGADSCPL
jgi:flagellar assembly protein FliH